jgi:thioredoxin-related protein
MRPFIPRALLAVAVLALLAAPGHAEEGFDDSVMATIKYPDLFKESFLNLQDDLAKAQEVGKDGLLFFFSTRGCSYCHLFIRTSLADPVLTARV